MDHGADADARDGDGDGAVFSLLAQGPAALPALQAMLGRGVSPAGAGEQLGQRLFRRELADRALRLQYVDLLGNINELEAALLGQVLQREAQALRRIRELSEDGITVRSHHIALAP